MKTKTLIVVVMAAIMLFSAMVVVFYPTNGAQKSNVLPSSATSGGYVTIVSYGTPHSYYAGIIASNGSTYNSAPAGNDVGIYIPSYVHGVTIAGASIHDENNYGIYSMGSDITISSTSIYNIGNHVGSTYSPNGGQTGVGIVIEYGNNVHIVNNVIYNYQKNAMAVVYSSNVVVTGNTVTGAGHINYNAQNGIEFWASTGTIRGNTISGNYYSASGWVATGLLLYDLNPGSVHASMNHFHGNQRNLYVGPAKNPWFS